MPRKRGKASQPAKTAKGLRHLALRGTAVAVLVLMVAIPFTTIIAKGFGDGVGTFRAAMSSPGPGRRSGSRW